MDPRIIMIGQVPVIAEEEQNSDAFGSASSDAPNEQTNQNVEQTSDSGEPEVPPANVPSFALVGGATGTVTERKHYRRHTAHQIQTLEAFFNYCPKPNEGERMELSHELGMDPKQVKFWFQNKRTQTKAQVDQVEHSQLRAQYKTLRVKSLKVGKALVRSACSACGSPHVLPLTPVRANDLSLENASLKKEIERLQENATQSFGSAFVNPNPNVPHQIAITSVEVVNEQPNAGGFGGEKQPNALGDVVFHRKEGLITSMIQSNVIDRQMIINLANAAVNELILMTQVNDPLWIPSIGQSHHMLNKEVYDRMFPKSQGFATPLSFRVEATRDSNVIMMAQMDLVDVMMNMEKFATVFSSMVSTASLLDAIITGNDETGYDGFLIVVYVEYQVLTPTIPKRESIFGRYCKKLENDTWTVVDLSIQDLHETLTHKKCHRMPSGCVIQTIPDGSCRVTWVEHVRLDNEGVHSLAMPLLDSGAFGAPKWLAVLSRHAI